MGNVFDSLPNQPHTTTQPTPPPAQKPNPVIYSGRLGQPPGMTVPFDLGKAAQNAETVVSGLNTALGYQFNKLWGAVTGQPTYEGQMKAIRQHIPGLEALYNAPPGIETKPGTVDRWIQDRSNEFAKGMIDAAISYPLDPLTYETEGLGRPLKALLSTPKLAPYIERIGQSLLNTHAVSPLYDFFHWAGPVKREGKYSVPLIRGAAGVASSEGADIQRHFTERFANIVEGKSITTADGRVRAGTKLSDPEIMTVQKALNGDIKPATLSVREATAYRQLRVLTNLDYELRKKGLIAIEAAHIPDLQVRQAVKDAFNSGTEPIIPKPGKRIQTPYGPEIPRQRNVYAETPPDYAKIYRDTVAPMTPTERATFSRGLTDPEKFKLLPPELQTRATLIQKAMKQRLTPTPMESYPLPPRQRYKMIPENQAEIEHLTAVKKEYDRIATQIENDLPKKINYTPIKRHAYSTAEGHGEITVSPVKRFDPAAMQRGEGVLITSPHQLREGFESMATNAGRQRSTAVLHDILGDALNDPKVAKALEKVIPATGAARSAKEWWRDMWLETIGYPRAATVSATPRHAMNVFDLAVNTVPPERLPQFTAEVSNMVRKLMSASPREAAEITKDGRELYGTVGGHFAERKAFFEKFPNDIPIAFTDKSIPLPKWIAGKGTGPVGWWTRTNNKLVWAVDMASASVYARMIKESGEATSEAIEHAGMVGGDYKKAEKLIAGGMARARLVDYENLTGFQKMLKYVAPFGTFRGGIPGAVLGGVVRDPPRGAFLSRATGGAFYGDRPQPGQAGGQYSGPTSDVGELLTPWEGTARFASGTLGNLPQAVAGTAANLIEQSQPAYKRPDMGQNPLSYGQSWLPKMDKSGRPDLGWIATQALGGIPEASAFLEAFGISRYKWKGLAHELLRQSTGLQYTTPTGPAPLPVWSAPGGGGGSRAPLPLPTAARSTGNAFDSIPH